MKNGSYCQGVIYDTLLRRHQGDGNKEILFGPRCLFELKEEKKCFSGRLSK